MKVTVNLDRNLMTLRGEPLDEKLSDILADILVTASTPRPAKTIAVAMKLVNEGKAEIDESDIDFIKEVVAGNNRVIDLAKAQIIQVLDESAKEKEG